MTDDVQDQKAAHRRDLRARLRSISSAPELSRIACETILKSRPYQRAKSILLYMPLQDELDVRLILEKATQEGRMVALPRFVPERNTYAAFFIGDKPLIPGLFGVLEPDQSLVAPLKPMDLIIVPGLGFDLRGQRLGRGKGFYDRMLSEASGVKCGICFDEQLVDALPIEPHDVGVHYVATPTRWLDCRGSTPDVK